MGKKLEIKIENRDTLDIKVCNILRKAILQGVFKPGERLIQEELAASLGVSRMPVREALRRLETEGLIHLSPHRGAIVKLFSVEDVREIYSLRAVLEEMAVNQSIGFIKEEDILKMEQLIQEMKRTKNVEEFIEKNIEFHKILMKHCPWKRLLSFIETLWNGFPQHTPHMVPGQIQLSNQEHDAILQAVKEKEAKKAGKLLELHIKRTGDSLVKMMENSNTKPGNIFTLDQDES